MAKIPEMSLDFAQWYAGAFMEEGAKRELRWKGVVDVASKANHSMAEVLVRLAFQTPVPASGRKGENLVEAYKKVVSSISGGETGFDPSHSKRELQILAAAALIKLVERSPDAAILVTTASVSGSRVPDLPMDLAGAGEKALRSHTSRRHARAGRHDLETSAQTVDFVVSDAALQSMDPTLWKGELDKLKDATQAAFERAMTGQNRVAELLHKQMSLDAEELQMLWWLLGGHSRALNKPFSEIAASFRPLALAAELGEMTDVTPGPASIGAMLSRAGVGTEPLKLNDVVNAADIGWAKSLSDSELISPVTTPIHFALEQRAELGTDDSWQAGWLALTGLSVDLSLPAVKFAELFYREHVFINGRG